MLKLFEFLLHGCWHQWKIYSISSLVDNSDGTKTVVGSRVFYTCEKCHRFKKQDVE